VQLSRVEESVYVKSPKKRTIWSYGDVRGESRRFGRKVGRGSGIKVDRTVGIGVSSNS